MTEQTHFFNELQNKNTSLQKQSELAATKAAEQIRIRGIKEAINIEAEALLKIAKLQNEAYQQSPSFYKFFYNLKAYEELLKQKTPLVLTGDNIPFWQSLTKPPLEEERRVRA